VEEFGFPPTTVRVPIMESACAGGAVALARAVDYLRSRPGETGLAVAAELCSLTFHAVFDEGTLLSVFLFGDAAGAVLLETGPGDGLEVVDSLTMLVAGSKEALGFDLTNLGLHPVLSRKLADVMTPYVEVAVSQLLSRNGLETSDVDAWLLHPGGPRILRAIEERFSLPEGTTRWSWDSLREFGNTSSAAVFDVLSRYFEEEPPDHFWAVLASFGPGVSIELVLLRRS
jgi:alkylresorcinol/alkylpyrone synthase